MLKRFLLPDRPNLHWALAILVVSFVGFHLSKAVLLSVSFQRLTFDMGWIPGILENLTRYSLTYGVGCLFAWVAYRSPEHGLSTACAAALCFVAAFEFNYPVLTAFLFQLGQFDSYPMFVMDRIPVYDEIFPPS
ncbi:hypothetical protein [Aliiroseovarius crassostreae]|uniref:hypothetical protein n=1 Tax=Aliiroseovarius crassostreae TaxID=154981 RepID=UPI002204F71C|nr:hypothetical protein [Aliiroseovarius crassostreae]UWQ05150.1 hypothetical protein K3X22_01355 [Aliiroseovarius crassostreae]